MLSPSFFTWSSVSKPAFVRSSVQPSNVTVAVSSSGVVDTFVIKGSVINSRSTVFWLVDLFFLLGWFRFHPLTKSTSPLWVFLSTVKFTVFDVRAFIVYQIPGLRVLSNLNVAFSSFCRFDGAEINVVEPIDLTCCPDSEFSRYKVIVSPFKKASSSANVSSISAELVVTFVIVDEVRFALSTLE